jgi:flagellar biosynthesis/type III secretory pathway M-ring protein FliF/YscJ
MKDGGTGNRKLADAAANLVAGAQQHLKVSNVKTVIGKRRYQIKGDDDGIDGSDTYGELVAAHERRLEEKVAGLYPYIDGLFVKIAVTVNMTSSQVQSKSVDPNVIQKERRVNTRNESEPVPAPGAVAEPGAMPNTGASIDALPQASIGGERTVDESDTEFENFAGTKSETLLKPAGDPTVLSAAVRVPRSYFLKAYKTMSGSTSEPAVAALQPVIDAESEKIRNEVVGCTAIGDVSKVVVSMYDDSPSPLLAAATVTPTGGLSVSLGSYGKEIAIGALALISLFMVSMMVRKSAPTPVVAAAPMPRETPHLDGGSEIAGLVGEGNPLLDAMELDEDAVRAQQMLDQVSTLVGENPDAAANLVKRWLNRT